MENKSDLYELDFMGKHNQRHRNLVVRYKMKGVYMKPVKVLSLCILMLFLVVNVCEAGTIAINVDGESVPYDENYGFPFINKDSRTLVPLRITMEAFGADVSWDSELNAASVTMNGVEVKVPIGKSIIYRNGIKQTNDTEAVIINGRTYLPIRAVVEALGGSVNWDGATQTVELSTDQVLNNLYNRVNVVIDLKNTHKTNEFTVKYYEYLDGEISHELSLLWDGEPDYFQQVKPFADDSDTYQIDEERRMVTYNLSGNGQRKSFGYTIDLKEGSMEAGFSEENFVCISTSRALRILGLEEGNKIIQIKSPNDLTLFSPYEAIKGTSDLFYAKKRTGFHNPDYDSGVIVLAEPTNYIEKQYNSHKMNLLGVGIEENNEILKLSEFVYDRYMTEIYDGIEYVLAPAYNIVYLSEEYPDGIRMEGFSGNQIEVGRKPVLNAVKGAGDWTGEILSPYANVRETGRIFVHQMAHTFDLAKLDGWWSVEGIAEYLMPLMLRDYGIMTESQVQDTLKHLINYYNTEIVDKDKDIPMVIISDNGIEASVLESKYPIKITSNDLNNYVNLSPSKGYEAMTGIESGWYVYQKGALIFCYLDEYIQKYSNDQYNLYSALNRYLSLMNEERDAYTKLEDVIGELTDTDFNGFFDRYVKDNQALPIYVEDDEIIIE